MFWTLYPASPPTITRMLSHRLNSTGPARADEPGPRTLSTAPGKKHWHIHSPTCRTTHCHPYTVHTLTYTHARKGVTHTWVHTSPRKGHRCTHRGAHAHEHTHGHTEEKAPSTRQGMAVISRQRRTAIGALAAPTAF